MYLWDRYLAVGAPLTPTRVTSRFARGGRRDAWRIAGTAAVTAVSRPDAVELVVAYLRAQHHLSGTTLVTARPADLGDRLPVLLVEPVGEPVRSRMPWARRDRWRLGLQVWAEGDEAGRLVRGTMTALLAARGVRLPDGGRIVRVDADADPIEVVDPKSDGTIRRIVTTVDVSVSY